MFKKESLFGSTEYILKLIYDRKDIGQTLQW